MGGIEAPHFHFEAHGRGLIEADQLRLYFAEIARRQDIWVHPALVERLTEFWSLDIRLALTNLVGSVLVDFCGHIGYNVVTLDRSWEMTQTKASIRELKANLSTYLRQVEAGQAVTITRRGRPVGRIVPISQPTEVQLDALKQAGLIAWNSEKLLPLTPLAQARGDRMVSDLLLENRE